jgi:hypothetical protein
MDLLTEKNKKACLCRYPKIQRGHNSSCMTCQLPIVRWGDKEGFYLISRVKCNDFKSYFATN